MEVTLPTSSSLGVEVVHNELPRLQAEYYVWVDAVKGAAEYLVNEAASPQREKSLLALNRAIELANEALERLIDGVFKVEVT